MQNAIGVFDSGLGGLSVLNSAITLLPNEKFIYVADSLHAPFGNKSDDFILKRCLIICEFLKKQNVKCILLACNTATLACVATLRESIDLPIVAIEPGLKPAVLHSKTKHILMLATSSTLQSKNYQQLVFNHSQNTNIQAQACDGWVELVESGHGLMNPTSANVTLLIEKYLNHINNKQIDQIVLGCTHYPFLKPLILKYLKSINKQGLVSVVDTSDAVAKQLQNVLKNKGLLNEVTLTCDAPQIVDCYSSWDKTQLSLLKSLCNSPIQFLGQFEPVFINQDLIDIFQDCFFKPFNTILVDEGDEPIYQPASATQLENRIYFAHGYFSSALHEIAHWLVAGEKRRQQEDYGYWYAPDGRNQAEQAQFEKVEVKPQAIEWILHQCCQKPFNLSLDNLGLPEQDSRPFARAVYAQTLVYLDHPINERMALLCSMLMKKYQNPDALAPKMYHLGDLCDALT